MTPDLLAKYDALRVPRYTSYPTAPHFSPAVGADHYREWLGRLAPGTGISLYLHVPFCESMCWYCGCHTRVVKRYQPIAEYLDLVGREIDLIAGLVPGRLTIRHIHWGGGTPNLVAPDDFQAVMDRFRQRFDVAADAEIAVEIDPRTMSAELAAAYGAAGVTRASLGVQDFDAEVQRAVNRIQPLDLSRAAIDRLRAAGIANVNLDLIYGLPGQTEEICRQNARTALSLTPQRLAVFGYAHVPWMKKHQQKIDEAALPDGPARWRQFGVIAETLTAAGHQPIGLDHFAVPDDDLAVAQRAGRLRRNFQGYTTDGAEALLGFGVSSIGALPEGYIQNATLQRDYAQAIIAGRPATARGIAIDADDLMRRDLIERLMCDLSVDLGAVAGRHGVSVAAFDEALDRLEPLVADGVATIAGDRLTVPEAARPLVRAVAAAFDSHLARGQAAGPRHARAV
ncbi:MAG: oxygen-independent coproporphyrinogen III oxidase [Azospirillum sp.]|nr:oxygen-independent coproporphyrinogen III oxidase [Azospirillum sp.]